ncbi:hypothetical protein KAR91_73080 [Candidatus Pacearchaeota archaeon]|nr:hypothetical protein [Candidatus Pacearchaeota archaeon]
MQSSYYYLFSINNMCAVSAGSDPTDWDALKHNNEDPADIAPSRGSSI